MKLLPRKHIKHALAFTGLCLLPSCSLISDRIEENINAHLAEPLEEYTRLAPEVQRILTLEADMQLLIEELSKQSNLDTYPLGTADSMEVAAEDQPQAPKDRSRCQNASTSGHCYKQIGIHIAAFAKVDQIQIGWRYLQKTMPSLLKDKLPLSTEIINNNKTYYSLRLGPFPSVGHAKKSCDILNRQKNYCAVTEYKGQSIY